jgi:3-hydroxyisobutyrate dehydrogenase
MMLAWIGTGTMGVPMVKRLLNAQHKLKIYNRTPENAKELVDLGVEMAATPKDAADGADIVFSIVTGNEASKAVWEGKNGITQGLKEGAVGIECSTLTPVRCVELQKYISEHAKATFLTAPVIGTFQDAENGKLIILAGGDAAAFESVKPTLSLLSEQIVYVGNHSQAMALKLAVTASISSQMLLQVELINFLKSCDIDAGIINLFNNLPFTGVTAKIMSDFSSTGQFEQLFSTDLVHKDLGYLVESQKTNQQKIALTNAAKEAYARAKIIKNSIEL